MTQSPSGSQPAKLRTTPESRRRMLELDAKATPGPWERPNPRDVFTRVGAPNASGVKAADNDGWQIADCGTGYTLLPDGSKWELEHQEQVSNADFLVHSRTFAPDAARDVETLVEERKVLLELLAEAHAHIDVRMRMTDSLEKRIRSVLESQEGA